MRHSETPLTGLEADAYERIEQLETDHDDDLTRAEVLNIISNQNIGDAEDLLKRLLQKGYVYAVNDSIRIT